MNPHMTAAGLPTLVARLEAEKAEAQRAVLAKSRFLAAAGHDLRQPLHALGLFVGDLRGAGLAADKLRVLDHMESAIDMAHGLLDGILSMARLESGKLAPEVVVFPVQDLLDRVARAFAPTARDKGLRLTVVPSPAFIRSDPALLERIVSNLVANAIRYTVRGGVLVGCRRQAGQISIQVWDTGIGIAAKFHAAVFDEFFRVKDPARDGGGLGLGLSIVKGNAALLKHAVSLKSRPGRGSCFAVLVPRPSAKGRASAPGQRTQALPARPLR